MKQITLNIPDKEYSFFIKLLKSLKFVQISASEYDAEFVKKIESSRREYENGEYVTVEKDNLKSFLGLE